MWLSSRRKKFSPSCLISGENGKARVAIVSQTIGENSSFINAEVRVPAIELNEESSFTFKSQRRKSSVSEGTYKPPSGGIQFSTAWAKLTDNLLFLVLVNFIALLYQNDINVETIKSIFILPILRMEGF